MEPEDLEPEILEELLGSYRKEIEKSIPGVPDRRVKEYGLSLGYYTRLIVGLEEVTPGNIHPLTRPEDFKGLREYLDVLKGG